MYLQRWITGLAILPFLIFLIYKGGLIFSIFICFIVLIALSEYFRIVFHAQKNPLIGILPVISMITGPAIILTANKYTTDLVFCIIALNMIVCAFFSFTQFKADTQVLERITKQFQAIIYIPILLSFAVLIRNGADGMAWLLFLLGIVFAGDIGALYAGTYWGKHKLCPSVSPGKTIEGSLGGLLANIFIGSIIKIFVFPRMDWGPAIVFFLCVGIAGQIGDLFESAFKREAGIKDSGVILPGHGGILDRIDALLFALPVAYFFKKFILWV